VEKVAEKPEKTPVERRRGFFIPVWALGGIFGACLTTGGAALNVWKNDSLRESQIAAIEANLERVLVKADRTEQKVDQQGGEIAHLKTDQGHFQSLVIDKIDSLLVTDRFRKNWK
jgi:hypothetical protein